MSDKSKKIMPAPYITRTSPATLHVFQGDESVAFTNVRTCDISRVGATIWVQLLLMDGRTVQLCCGNGQPLPVSYDVQPS